MATLAEVSLGTVSHYINHPSRVSPEKSARIQRAIDQLGYVRNNAAWQLRLGRSGTIAYIAPDIANPVFANVADGIEQRAAIHGLSVLISNTNRSRAREDTYLEMFESHRVQGLLVASHEPMEERLAAIRLRGIPSVLVGQRGVSPAQPSVSVDDVAGGYLATRHLLDIGRRRIAFVGGPLGIPQIADRLQGAGAAVREVMDASLEVINMSHRSIPDGRDVGKAILARPAGNRPDAIFAVNDITAIGVLQALVGGGVRVPDEIALIGYDDIEFGAASLVPLSTISTPHGSTGTAATDLLVELMNDDQGDSPRQIVFPPELVVRASTAG